VDDGLRDLWVIAEPQSTWPVGEVLTFAAGAEGIEPATFQFLIRAAAHLEPHRFPGTPVPQPDTGFDEDGVGAAGASADVFVLDAPNLPILPGGVGPAFRIGPNQVFDEARRVWLPKPARTESTPLELWYFHETGPERGWYPAENVLGWLVQDSELELTNGGVTYVGVALRHGGVVQLRQVPEEAASANAASALPFELLSRKGAGDALVLLVLAAAFLIAGKRSARLRDRAKR
jgi:hypothetical protein